MSNQQATQPEATQPEVSQSTEVQPPQLNLQHLINVLNIIDLSSQRGAFRATELEGIGNSYNAIKRFLEYHQQKLLEQQEQQEQQES